MIWPVKMTLPLVAEDFIENLFTNAVTRCAVLTLENWHKVCTVRSVGELG